MHKKKKKKLSAIKILTLCFFAAMTVCMLCHSARSSQLALEGLNLWFTKMIPALLPFMILSGVLIGTGLSDSFAALFAPVLGPLFRLSDSCLYCIIIGFLCGFPMGARVCAQSLEKGRISAREATLLLAFCNNIGPVYFTGYVLGLFPIKHIPAAFAGMYGIPLLYGLLLRYTLFRQIPASKGQHAAKTPPPTPGMLLAQLHTSILSGLDAITVLGGYMIFCNLLNLLPGLLFQAGAPFLELIGPLLEITSGLARLSAANRTWAYIVLPFGGLSCIAQTYSCIQNTELSLAEYTFHKIVQTVLTAAFYGFFPIG